MDHLQIKVTCLVVFSLFVLRVLDQKRKLIGKDHQKLLVRPGLQTTLSLLLLLDHLHLTRKEEEEDQKVNWDLVEVAVHSCSSVLLERVGVNLKA